MSPETHSQMAHFIWAICNFLRGPYKRNEYRKVILPLNRHFYRYEPPRPLDQIEAGIRTLEGEIVALLKEVTA